VTATSPTAPVKAPSSGSGSTATTPIVATHESTPPSTPTTGTDIGDAENGPLAKAGVDLITIYQDFEAQGGSSTFTSSKAGVIRIQGGTVGVDIRTTGSNFSQFVSTMSSLGMQVQTQDATHGIVEGFLPIGQLPTVAQNAQTVAITPIYIPKRL
jgi:hypothetical protein